MNIIIQSGFCLVLMTASIWSAIPSAVTTGSQYIWQEANTTNIISPQFQPASVANLTVTNVSSSSNALTKLSISGNPVLDNYDVPIVTNEYVYAGTNQPNTYYVLVTNGVHNGDFFTIVSNDSNSITIDNGGHTLFPPDVKGMEIRPYWTLATLFPPNMESISFIPTTNSSNPMTTLSVTPEYIVGSASNISFPDSYYYNPTISNWVNSTNLSINAGDTIVKPCQVVYSKNTGSGSYALNNWFAGTTIAGQVSIHLYVSSTNFLTTIFSLPRPSSYYLSQIGFGFVSRPSSYKGIEIGEYGFNLGPEDNLLTYNQGGAITKKYVKKRNAWFELGHPNQPVDPLFPSGTTFGVVRAPQPTGPPISHSALLNSNNIR